MRKLSLQTLIEVAILAAFAMVLDLLPSLRFGPSISISFAMIPIFIVAFRWGFVAASLSGFLWGLLQIALGQAWILTPTQAFIEYFIAFACIGFAGLFYHQVKGNLQKGHKGHALLWMTIAIFVGGATRYFWHFVAGVIFFKKYAIEAGKSPFIYSLVTNGITYIAVSIACAVILGLIVSKAGQIITSAKQIGQQRRAG
ncbi:energy-coupled thiamine transporter ThiT [Lentibacillus sp. L22]|uniref:energy-coupled thiamine transporter ThiT n=1 Tax=Lentibacillus TaxID=175304 RepID=UPI0022B1F89D|nr:energy-coupled thiamine transporter ThiT [Lentibacillus daqui]